MIGDTFRGDDRLKTKVILGHDEEDLERKINDFYARQQVKVVNVKFGHTTVIGHRNAYVHSFSALIHYYA